MHTYNRLSDHQTERTKEYLIEIYSWTLVGAEQTTKSVNLFEMTFDKKTILILGNDKNGIPADLIPLLDVCIKIPQNGVIGF